MSQTLVLITDDDEDDRLFLRQAVDRHLKKATVCEAQNGEEAITCLSEEAAKANFSLVLLDINMPGMNGFEVLQAIRNSPSLKDIPTVILSTTANSDQVNKAYQLGANAYVQKPRSFDGYNKIVQAVSTCFLEVINGNQP